MQIIHIYGYMAVCLHGIGMEQNTLFSGNFPDFGYGLKGSDFIVGKHHGNQYGIRPDCFF